MVLYCKQKTLRQQNTISSLILYICVYQVHSPCLPLSPHQRRVSVSLAKLNIPAWYSDRKPPARTQRRWRGEKEGRRGWRRRPGTQSCAVSRPITPDSISLCNRIPLDSSPLSHSTQRWSYHGKENREPSSPSMDKMSSVKSSNSFLSYREPYLGWRSQERLKLSSSYLSSPSQRLASSLLNTPNLSRIRE